MADAESESFSGRFDTDVTWMSMSSSKLIFFNTLADGRGGSRTWPESVPTHKAQSGASQDHFGKRRRRPDETEAKWPEERVGSEGRDVILLQASLLVMPEHGFAHQFGAGFQAELLLDAGIV